MCSLPAQAGRWVGVGVDVVVEGKGGWMSWERLGYVRACVCVGWMRWMGWMG